MFKVYGCPNTDSFVIMECELPSHLEDQGYIEMIGLPPKLTNKEKIDGYVYMCDKIGQWVLRKDPNHVEKIKAVIKKIYNVQEVTPNMVKLIANKLLEISEKI